MVRVGRVALPSKQERATVSVVYKAPALRMRGSSFSETSRGGHGNLLLEPELVGGQAVGGGHHGIRQRMCAPRTGVCPVGRTRTGCRTPRAITQYRT
jgi:hypothetical protein